jgi:3-oxoacyl-ACP reductase-like protein
VSPVAASSASPLTPGIQAAGPGARAVVVTAPATAPAPKPAGPGLPRLPLAAGIALIALLALGVSLRVR